MYEHKQKTSLKELIVLSDSPIYNVCVEYFGENKKVNDFFSSLNIWGYGGEYKGEAGFYNKNEMWVPSAWYRYEVSRNSWSYFKDELAKVMARYDVEVQFTN